MQADIYTCKWVVRPNGREIRASDSPANTISAHHSRVRNKIMIDAGNWDFSLPFWGWFSTEKSAIDTPHTHTHELTHETRMKLVWNRTPLERCSELKNLMLVSLFARQTCSTTWLARVFFLMPLLEEDAQCVRTHFLPLTAHGDYIGRGLGRAPFIGNANTCASEYDTATLNALLLCSFLSSLGFVRCTDRSKIDIFSAISVCAVAHVPAKHQHRVRICWLSFAWSWFSAFAEAVPYAHNAEQRCYVTPSQLKCSLYSSIPPVPCARCVRQFFLFLSGFNLAARLFAFEWNAPNERPCTHQDIQANRKRMTARCQGYQARSLYHRMAGLCVLFINSSPVVHLSVAAVCDATAAMLHGLAPMKRNSIRRIIWIHVEISSSDVAHFFMCAHDDCAAFVLLLFYSFRFHCKELVCTTIQHGSAFVVCFTWFSFGILRLFPLRARITFQSIIADRFIYFWHISWARCAWMGQESEQIFELCGEVACKSR